ncbi:MAG: PDZ domain-containing protein [Fimbriimonadaceae bacterium]|nr:PDZ domain-containing protein [Fimbriimonadaceae bacterium]
MTTALLLGIAAVTRAEPIEVPFRVGENAMIVDVEVNGKKISCMFDTGFSGSFVLSEEVNVGPPTGTTRIQDFVGTAEMKTIAIKSVKLAGKSIVQTDKEIIQEPGGSDYSFSYGTHVDGIMGLSVVAPYVVEINFQRKVMLLHPKSTDITQRQPDNKKTFLVKMLPIGNKSIELSVKTKDGQSMHLALDTGNAFYATTHRDVLERVGIWKEGREAKFLKKSFVATGAVDSWYCRMKDLTVFGVPVPESVWSIIDLPSSSAEGDGTVGFGFLKNFNLTFDLERRRVWLENFTGQVSEPEVAHTGVSAIYDPRVKRVRIARVTPDSPADKAGIKAGDFLLSVGGVDMTSQSYRAIEAMMEGPVGSEVKIQTSRNNALRTSVIKRVAMVNDP